MIRRATTRGQTYVFPAKDRVAKDDTSLGDMIAKGLFGPFLATFPIPKIPLGWKRVEQNPVANVPLGPAPPAEKPRRPIAILQLFAKHSLDGRFLVHRGVYRVTAFSTSASHFRCSVDNGGTGSDA